MPATRSRTSTEQPEVVDEVKKNEVVEQSEDSNTKESIDNVGDDNTTSTTTDEKDVETNDEGTNDGSNGEVKETSNGVEENGSAKRKSVENGEGDGAETAEVTPKKIKVATDEESNVEKEDENPVVEAAV